ncbi:MAG TPA: ABC transporter substrate-binding protein [Candidatus Limnocylindrales bacterium]|nr:ABC transporter substrate-binding protein [Candidatus Limnocylindrales bacterium]
MKTRLNAFVLVLALLFSASALGADKVIISYSSRSYAFLPAQIAVARGFFKDDNLEPLLIQMRSQVTVPALLSGEVHYTLSFGNIIGSAMAGLPFKILGVLTDKPLHSIVARPEIKTIADLRGKRIGSQRIGGSDQLAAEAILQARGIDLKDVQFITLGGDEPVRTEMLRKGLVDAICTVPPGPVRLAREGYNVLGGPKDLKVGSPISAVAVTDTRLKTHREETKKVLRAVLRGLRIMHERRDDTIAIMSKWLNQSADVARDSYDSILPSFSLDGGTTDKTYEFAIDSRKASVRADKPIPLSQVRDLSLLREVQKELRSQ